MSIRLFFTDLEGTIYAKQRLQLRPGEPHHHHSLWSRLMHELGPAALAEDAKTISKWESGQYRSYLDWCDESLRIVRRHGLTQDKFESILDRIPFNPGVEEALSSLHRRGVKTVIISGGFIEQARRAQKRLRITHAYAAVDLLWNDDGTLDHWNTFPSDYEGKVDFVRLMMREYGFTPEECGFIGDGKNDIFIAREVGVSFAYQAHNDLINASNHRIDHFSDILKFL